MPHWERTIVVHCLLATALANAATGMYGRYKGRTETGGGALKARACEICFNGRRSSLYAGEMRAIGAPWPLFAVTILRLGGYYLSRLMCA